MVKTKAFSFKGWKLWELLKGNKEVIKVILSFFAGLSIPSSPLTQIIVGASSKLLLDIFDYWLKQE